MTVYYTEEHEWISVEGDQATVGITDFAQGQLGDIVFVELPEAGRQVSKGGEAAVVESVKAASDVYAPVSGTVIDQANAPIGKVTSGGFAPSVGAPIAMAYVPRALAAPGTPVRLFQRGKIHTGIVTAMPFVPHRYVRAGGK